MPSLTLHTTHSPFLTSLHRPANHAQAFSHPLYHLTPAFPLNTLGPSPSLLTPYLPHPLSHLTPAFALITSSPSHSLFLSYLPHSLQSHPVPLTPSFSPQFPSFNHIQPHSFPLTFSRHPQTSSNHIQSL